MTSCSIKWLLSIETFIVFLNVYPSYQISPISSLENPQITAKPNFDFKKFLGKWYGIEMGYNLHGKPIDCANVIYNVLDYENGVIESDESFKMGGVPVKEPLQNGKILPCKDNCAKFSADFHVPVDPIGNTVNSKLNLAAFKKTRWLVLDTDYENYAIEWGEKLGILTLSRTNDYLPGTKEMIYQKLKGWGFDPTKLLKIDQTNCKDVN